MYEYRQALMRMRQGDSEREIARSKLMGRSKAARLRELARAQGWLDPERPLPEDAEIAAALGQPKLPVTAQSSIAAYRPLVEQWLTQGVSGVVIHTTLKREHGFSGHYSSVRRLIAQIGREQPRLFQIYAAGNFIEATPDTPYFQIGESKYGKPIIDRVVKRHTTLDEAAKLALISMDSTIRSNLSVGLPLDLAIIKTDALAISSHVNIDAKNEYFAMIRNRWSEALGHAFDELPNPDWLDSGEQS